MEGVRDTGSVGMHVLNAIFELSVETFGDAGAERWR
jgi:hypothetical protein